MTVSESFTLHVAGGFPQTEPAEAEGCERPAASGQRPRAGRRQISSAVDGSDG